MRKSFQIVCLGLLFVLSILVLGAGVQAEAAPPDAPAPAAERLQADEAGFQVEGRLVPERFANLALRLSGRVEEVFVQDGDRVESGQVLLRLGGRDPMLAEIAAAEMELLMAQQGLEELHKNAALQGALAERELAQAQKELSAAEYVLGRLKQGPPQLSIDQAHANILLAEKALNKVRDELSRTERQFADKNDPIWMFVSRRQVKLLMAALEGKLAAAQKRYEDAVSKYLDLIAPPDEVELAIAEADLALAQARLADAQQRRAALTAGPDPDEVAAAQARLKAAEAALNAAKDALQELQLLAPFTGTVVDVSARAGEWAEVGQPVVVLAGLSDWVVETDDLTEIQVPQVRVGQQVLVTLDALPALQLNGTIRSISDVFELKRGDVTYTARITLPALDPRLRWGMTVAVTFEE